mmetsp:Transcript_14566/g.19155  ORF Transcript_14566/g.19155 Transcript_14566/m.19155 type:complete len:623 (+) Transcript_14566:77-1945(+)
MLYIKILFSFFLAASFIAPLQSHNPHHEEFSLKLLSPENLMVQQDPAIHLWTSPTAIQQSGDRVTVEWQGVEKPCVLDFVAVYTPAEALKMDVDGQLTSLGTVPVQYQFAHVSNTHLEGGYGSLSFQLLNLRDNFIVGFFRGGTNHPVLAAISDPIVNLNPNEISHMHLALVGDGTADMRVTWVTRDEGSPTVQWREAGDSRTQNVEWTNFETSTAESRTFSKDYLCGAPSNTIGYHSPGAIHSAKFVGLQPSTLYEYRVGDAETGIWSAMKTFVTAPSQGSKDLVSFALFGDMGTAMPDGSLDHIDFPEQKAALGTMELIRQRNQQGFSRLEWPYSTQRDLQTSKTRKGLDFVLHIGDISYAVGYATHWDEFLHQIEDVASEIPWMVGIGNHERDSPDTSDIRNETSFYTGTDSGGECGVPYAAYFPMPEPAQDYRLDTPWYSFEYGPVHITVMSTEHDFCEGSKQYKWIKRDFKSIDRAKTPWAILAGHRPMYIDSDWWEDLAVGEELKESIEPLMMKFKINLGVYGHHHSYQRTCKVYKEQCTDDALKIDESFIAPTHLVLGMAGFDLSKTFSPITPTWVEYVDKKSHGMAFITANSSSLHFEFVESENTEEKVDEFWL